MPQVGTVRVKVDDGKQDSTADRPQTAIGYVVDSANFFDNVTVRAPKGKTFLSEAYRFHDACNIKRSA